MNDRITIPALNELNSHETRRNRVPNPRYTYPEIEANASTRNSPQLTLILSTLLASEKSRVVVLVVVVVHRFRSPSFQSREWARFQRGLPLPRISFSSRRRRREDPVWKRATRTKATRRGGLKGDRVDPGPRRLARLVRYFNGSSNLRYFVGRDRRWRATRVFIMRC